MPVFRPFAIAVSLVPVVLTACAGREANPVAVTKPFDSQLSCAHLIGEYDNNFNRLTELTKESADKVANNIGYLVLNPLAAPILFDVSQTQKVEAEALTVRNAEIIRLGQSKSCAGLPQLADTIPLRAE
jgi:hypothetical protein